MTNTNTNNTLKVDAMAMVNVIATLLNEFEVADFVIPIVCTALDQHLSDRGFTPAEAVEVYEHMAVAARGAWDTLGAMTR